jgi:hypothetical protein
LHWEQFMKQFADVVGRALAKRWLAQQLASGKRETMSIPESTKKEEKSDLHMSRGSENTGELSETDD